ncbi:MAG: NFACT family protein, partial [Pyrinomonadaceae bacterium]
MHENTVTEIVEEISLVLPGRTLGRSFHLRPLTLAFDFRPFSGAYLFISVEPNQPRLYLIKRKLRDLEKLSLEPSQFLLRLRKVASRAKLLHIAKTPDERIVHFTFEQITEIGDSFRFTLVAQLTGRSANLFLLDEAQKILFRLRNTSGQQIAESYCVPQRSHIKSSSPPFTRGSFATLSEAADNYYLQLEAELRFKSRAKAVATHLRKGIEQLHKLRQNLLRDLAGHGDPDEHKRIGELILANLSSAQRRGEKVIIKDYYTEGLPEIEILVQQNKSLAEEADRRFALYSKAKKARTEISQRLQETAVRRKKLESEQSQLDEAIAGNIAGKNENLIERYLVKFGEEERSSAKKGSAKKDKTHIPGVRRFLSSDGFEILVGRNSKDNDHLTFRLAQPNDTWLH